MTLSVRQQSYLKLLGVDIWVGRESRLDQPFPETVVGDQPDTSLNEDSMDWDELKDHVSICNKCILHKARTQTVFGSGSQTADWMLIGEAPGAEDDRLGKPFVGRAGKLLTSMLNAIGKTREQVYIANILKCHPPNNRDPAPEEVSSCEEYLRKQILFIKPKLILALGKIAAQNLLNTNTPIGKMRGKVYEYSDLSIPLVVTYHPAYLLRSPREKQKSWHDLQLALTLFKKNSL